jgi:hypothetical protein
VFRHNRKNASPGTDRQTIAQPWQVEAYRHVNICGEARYAVSLFAAIASRAEIGVSEPQALARKAVWIKDGEEVEAFAELCPNVRDRQKLIRDYMTHRVIAGECYLIARDKVDTDPLYDEEPRVPIWEIVAVTELRKIGSGENEVWSVRHDNGNYLDLAKGDPVIRLWNPDPSNRREAWSPFRSMLPTLREIEWLTMHIFTQVRSRLMSAGVWFLPDNLTFPPPPPDSVEGGAEAIAEMNEAEQFMLSLAASSMTELDADEVSFPSIVMADAVALEAIDQKKLIQFWSNIDDKAMTLRSDAIRRFALGMDLTPEQTLGSSGIAVSGTSGSAGSVNHWGEWANEEKTIAGHIEPALSDLVAVLTIAFLRQAVEGTDKVIGFDPSSIRMKQDRSKEAMEWYDRGWLSPMVALRETGFDPENDVMTDDEFKRWLLTKIVGGSFQPEQMVEAVRLLGVVLPAPVSGNEGEAQGLPGRSEPPSKDEHPVQGPPQVQHDQSEAPYSLRVASCEGLVLRALEKAGNRLLNEGKRGRDRDRTTPPHLAHTIAEVETAFEASDFDFTMASMVFSDIPAMERAILEARLGRYCANLYANSAPYTRESLIEAVTAP